MQEIEKIYILYKNMVINDETFGASWKNIELGKQVFSLMKSLPQTQEGELESPAQKVRLLLNMLTLMDEMSTPRFCIEVREYVSILCPDDEENRATLAMLRDYIDPSLKMEEYCAKYKRFLKFDPVERSLEWEKVIYRVEQECEEILQGEPRGMGFCFMYWAAKAKVLSKYGIRWKSPSQMNPGVLFD